MLQPMLNAVYKHIPCPEELLSSLQFHSDCLAFDQLGLLILFQAEPYLNHLSSCSKVQMLMHGFKGELSRNMLLDFSSL